MYTESEFWEALDSIAGVQLRGEVYDCSMGTGMAAEWSGRSRRAAESGLSERLLGTAAFEVGGPPSPDPWSGCWEPLLSKSAACRDAEKESCVRPCPFHSEDAVRWLTHVGSPTGRARRTRRAADFEGDCTRRAADSAQERPLLGTVPSVHCSSRLTAVCICDGLVRVCLRRQSWE